MNVEAPISAVDRTERTETGVERHENHGEKPASAGENYNNRGSKMIIEGKSVASQGLGGTALGLGAGALGVQLLNGGLNGILGGWRNNGNAGVAEMIGVLAGAMMANGGCRNHEEAVTRHELEQEKELALKDSEIALLKSEKFTDAKILEASNVLLGRIQNIEARLGAIDVQNQATQDAIVQVKSDLCLRLANEAEKRACNDNALANYMNATFYPKMVAGVTTGTDTTAQSTYNPVRDCCNGRAA